MMTTACPQVTTRPWGTEEVIYAGEYLMKHLTIRPGQRLSLQYHPVKTETVVVLSGIASIQLGDTTSLCPPGTATHIPAGAVHRFSAPLGTVELIEASTATEGTVRIEDDYGRESDSVGAGLEIPQGFRMPQLTKVAPLIEAPLHFPEPQPSMVTPEMRPGGALEAAEEVTLIASPFRSFDRVNEFQDRVSELDGVRGTRIVRFQHGSLRLQVEYDGMVPFPVRLRQLRGFALSNTVERADSLLEVAVGA